MINPYKQIESSKVPKGRVELHLHLDGSIRHSTILELAQKKGIKIGNDGTLEELKRLCSIEKPTNLIDFLKKWEIFFSTVIGDSDALERIAYELCEDQSKENVIYAEVRYSPHICSNAVEHSYIKPQSLLSPEHPNAITPRDVVIAISKGIKRGEKDFNIKVRSIISTICGRSEWSEEILSLATEFKDSGVVGIDIAGDMSTDESIGYNDTVSLFKRAKELGIHRTVHAGEAGSAANVQFAIEHMYAERIGHGYRVIDDEHIYRKCLSIGIHFETCPHSSFLTGAIPLDVEKHPIVRFAEDDANFSISKDDTTPIQTTLDDEYRLLAQMGLTELHLIRANINAAKSSFLPENEKKELLNYLYKIYGFGNYYDAK